MLKKITKKSLAKIAKDARLAMKISQWQLAKKAGVSQASISRLESGDNETFFIPTLKVLRVLGIDVKYCYSPVNMV